MAVVGGGLAGLSVAWWLTRHGLRPVVIEGAAAPDEEGGGAGAGGTGHVECAPSDLPTRTAALIGTEAMAAIVATTRINATLLGEFAAGHDVAWRREGAWSLTTDPAEMEELERSARLLEGCLGTDERWQVRDAAEVIERTGTRGFIGGVFRPADAACDPVSMIRALDRAASRDGAAIHRGVIARGIDTRSGEACRVMTDAGSLIAEIVVVAAGAGSVSVHAEARRRCVPVPVQALRFDGLAAGGEASTLPVAANFGHVRCRAGAAQGGWRLRAWHIPWSLKSSDPEGREAPVDPVLQERLEAWLQDHCPASHDLVRARAARRWACFGAWTEDNLPLVGPLPGTPRVIACFGFSGHDWSLAFAAGRSVAAAIAGVPVETQPAPWSARRFVGA